MFLTWRVLLFLTCINHTLSKRGRLVVLSKNFKDVVTHKCVLFLNFEFVKKKKRKKKKKKEKKKEGGWVVFFG